MDTHPAEQRVSLAWRLIMVSNVLVALFAGLMVVLANMAKSQPGDRLAPADVHNEPKAAAPSIAYPAPPDSRNSSYFAFGYIEFDWDPRDPDGVPGFELLAASFAATVVRVQQFFGCLWKTTMCAIPVIGSPAMLDPRLPDCRPPRRNWSFTSASSHPELISGDLAMRPQIHVPLALVDRARSVRLIVICALVIGAVAAHSMIFQMPTRRRKVCERTARRSRQRACNGIKPRATWWPAWSRARAIPIYDRPMTRFSACAAHGGIARRGGLRWHVRTITRSREICAAITTSMVSHYWLADALRNVQMMAAGRSCGRGYDLLREPLLRKKVPWCHNKMLLISKACSELVAHRSGRDAIVANVLGRNEVTMILRRVAETCAGVGRARDIPSFICSGRRTSRGWPRPSILATVALLLISPLCAQAQEPLKIGVLALGPRNIPAWQCGPEAPPPGAEQRRRDTMPSYVLGLLDELEKLEYVEMGPDGKPKKSQPPASAGGRRFVLDLRMGTVPQLRAAAREFVQKQNSVDVIVAVATLAVRIAQEETQGSSIPILMTGVSEPVTEGFVQSLARPGGMTTGVSHQLVQGTGKRVELFKELLPGLQRLLTIRVPGYTPSEKSLLEMRAAADRFKIDILDWTVNSREDLQAKLATVRRDTADGIMISPDSLIISNLDLVIETSLAQRVPAMGLFDYTADFGAIAAYGPSAFQAGARVARYVDKVSKAAKPGDLPVEPVDPTFVVNLKAAECLGVSLPLQVLQQADRIIR